CGCLPHQASFSRANLFFSKIGLFNERYRISSDYEWFLRLIQNETVKLCYYPRAIASYYAGGLSSQLRQSLPETHSIQNQCPMYQDSYWLNRRIIKYQEFVINLREWLKNAENSGNTFNINYKALETEYHALKLELEQARAKIAQIAKIVEMETGVNQNGQSSNIKLNLKNLEQV
ncbi:MAG: glycosyltransferase, partial [Moorea sp. SIO4A3]|nr:glycosyltransferase [Moorena sp. SIO4A3]